MEVDRVFNKGGKGKDKGKQGSDGKGKEWWNNMWQFVVAVVVEKAAVVTRDSFAELIVTGVENVQRRRTSLL